MELTPLLRRSRGDGVDNRAVSQGDAHARSLRVAGVPLVGGLVGHWIDPIEPTSRGAETRLSAGYSEACQDEAVALQVAPNLQRIRSLAHQVYSEEELCRAAAARERCFAKLGQCRPTGIGRRMAVLTVGHNVCGTKLFSLWDKNICHDCLALSARYRT